MSTSLKELVVTFEANVRPVINSLKLVDSKINRSIRRVDAISKSFNRMGKRMSLGVTAPMTALGATSLVATSEMQALDATLSSVLRKYKLGIPIQQAVTNEIAFLKEMTDKLGVSFQVATKPYVKYLAASKDSLEVTRGVAKSFLGLSSALGLSSIDVNRVMRALEQFQSKRQIMAEELKLQLGDAIPGAISLFAESFGMTEAKLLKLMKTKGVSSSEINKVAVTINTKYASAIEKGSARILASFNRVMNAFFVFRSKFGDGIDEVFKVNVNMNKFSTWLNKTAENFGRLDAKGKKIIMFTGGLLAGLGPGLLALGFAFKIFVKPILILLKSLKPFAKFFTNIVRHVPQLLRFFGSLVLTFLRFNPITAIFTGLVTAAYTIHKYWKEIKEFMGKSYEYFSKISFDSFKQNISSGVDGFKNYLSEKGMLPGFFTTEKSGNQQQSNVVNNSMTINIPPGTTASDSLSIKNAVKQALQEQNMQSYFEVGVL